MKISHIVIGIAVVLVVIVYLLGLKERNREVPQISGENVAVADVCTEGARRLASMNIFECIKGEWIYVGQRDNYKD